MLNSWRVKLFISQSLWECDPIRIPLLPLKILLFPRKATKNHLFCSIPVFYRQNSQRLPILPMNLLRIHIQIVAKKTVVVLLTGIATKKSHDSPAGSPLKIHGFPMFFPSFPWFSHVFSQFLDRKVPAFSPGFWQNAAALYCCSVSWAMRMSKALPVWTTVEQRWISWYPKWWFNGGFNGI